MRILSAVCITGLAIALTASALAQIPPAQRPARKSERQARHQQNERSPSSLAVEKITITIGSPDGTIKPLLGVNAGPLPSGEKGNAELTDEYKAIGVTAIRTHDFYGPMDLSKIYPDINADPGNPASYDFSSSDTFYRAITSAGFVPYLRIGDSYNDVRIPKNNLERKNLVRAAVEVVRHYRTSNLNGSRPLRYVEILNEPDNKQFWPAGFEDCLPFFGDVYTALKNEFPGLEIGGPAFVVASYKIPAARKNVARFIDYLKSRGINPDFISYHIYSNDPGEYYDATMFFRAAAQRAGFSNARMHITEWNTESRADPQAFRTGPKAASYTTAAWIALQQAQTDAAYLYRGTDTSANFSTFYGIFYADGRPKPAAEAFSLWSRMCAATEKLSVRTGVSLIDATPNPQNSLSPLWILAGRTPSGKTLLLISNIGNQTIACDITRPAQTAPSLSITRLNPLTIGPLSVQLIEFD